MRSLLAHPPSRHDQASLGQFGEDLCQSLGWNALQAPRGRVSFFSAVAFGGRQIKEAVQPILDAGACPRYLTPTLCIGVTYMPTQGKRDKENLLPRVRVE